jgi:glycosyltransferase involved in cell wall biosynthesis
MKILTVNYSDSVGGAARAALRLHLSLKNYKIESLMLVQSKHLNDASIISPNAYINKLLVRLRNRADKTIFNFFGSKDENLFSPCLLPGSNFAKRINNINPDIVHLHWVAGGMMTFKELHKIKAPIVWSLHDMWPFTDGYHYDTKYSIKENEGLKENIPLASQKVIKKHRISSLKKIKNITFVGLSKWMHQSAKSSDLLRSFNHVHIPNPIDSKIFYPIKKEDARNILGIPANRKYVLFGAMGGTQDPRKGFDHLKKAINLIPDDYEFLVFGDGNKKIIKESGRTYHYLGFINSDKKLSILYSSADAMVVPSMQENLSNAIMEAQSCATPVIAFDIGGNSDLVLHKQTGYLAKPFSSKDLANGIIWTVTNNRYLSHQSRNNVLNKFCNTVVTPSYISLYKKILSSKSQNHLNQE